MTLLALDEPRLVWMWGGRAQVLVQYEAVVGDPDTFGKVDHVTCRERWSGARDAHRPGVCGAVVPVPHDGTLPDACPYGHRLPWHGTLVPTQGPVR
jgi:hypothetical protein